SRLACIEVRAEPYQVRRGGESGGAGAAREGCMSDGLLWIKSSTILIPGTDESALWLAKKKNGATIVADVHEMRNGAFFRKWWSLVQYAFDHWSERCEPMEYRGMPVLPNFERFRKDVTILSGFYVPVHNIKGELRVEAESLKWAKMT